MPRAPDPYYVEFGRRVREARRRAGLKQGDVARALGLAGASSVSQIESGRQGVPLHHVLELVQVLDAPLEALLPPRECPIPRREAGSRDVSGPCA